MCIYFMCVRMCLIIDSLLICLVLFLALLTPKPIHVLDEKTEALKN